MEWFVVIAGDIFDLEELSKSLNSSGLCITRKGEEFILKSTDFNLLKDADDVRNKANEIISQINGAARLTLGMRKPLAVASVGNIDDDGTVHGFVSISFSETINLRTSVSASVIAPDGTIQERHQGDPIPSWITVAQHDTNVAKALRLFGAGTHDWVSLYRIYEVIESDVGGKLNIINNGWATEKSIKRFKYTANSPGAIGDEARHGKNTIPPPKDPMTLSEAKPLIETILRNWLRSKSELP
ncbi:hypothetical protein ANME2D_02487 [Candidatus Methanoperedens nitroreducens]|uniref:Uncharacterized protein n=1 Tax=Candidatus Methanoperedens nitratireducens TaxID=1392998 RepID=A0A062V7B3_9EURY|nr:hypothetical protein [Candidatus Methanoperedens nitroreducens]KCZ71285.1 hypothetical protein ANME2D_02487 [Candidatus Methanoperedens nitroreducens]MDJ1420287.1 hypothetical protein [Candidatus Methanoperedens sp.]